MQRLRAIPDGQITATAKRAGFPLTALLRLRRGEGTNVKLDSLERLARGLQIPPSELIAGEPGTEVPKAAQRGIDPRVVRNLIKKARAFVGDVERYASSLAEEEEPESSAPTDQGPTGTRGKK